MNTNIDRIIGRIRFSLFRPKANWSLIQIRMMLSDGRFTYYLPRQLKINPLYWDNQNGCAVIDSRVNADLKGNPILKKHLLNINSEIEQTRNTLIDILQECQRKKQVPTVSHVRNQIRFKLDPKTNLSSSCDLLKFVHYYLEDVSDYRPSTLTSHWCSVKILKTYFDHKRKRLRLDQIDLDFYNDFTKYLIVHNYKLNTVGKIIKHIKTWMRRAYEKGFTVSDDYRKKTFRKPTEDKETIYLSTQELKQIDQYDCAVHLEKVKDMFILAAYTGLRFSDFSRLKRENITKNNTIRLQTQKTNEIIEIPLHPIVKRIIRKYDFGFPSVPSNSLFNEYIKRIAKGAGIKSAIIIEETRKNQKVQKILEKWQLVTAHTARRSFATNAYLAHVPTLAIMKITGHSSEKVFLRYIRITQEDNARQLQEHPFFKGL
ncbi:MULTISPECIES: site-specific integrase [Porphyromonadaceae]|uniref:site-specific integrase n=1 Tax=Porphyromonadaceae TaxID=171551 RepID=UPI0008AA419D|nr:MULTISPECIES: site-specific integrase [Porphyromonadaceae]